MLSKAEVDYFDTLYDEYAPAVFGYILKKINDSHEAENMLIEVFIRALKNPISEQNGNGARLIHLLKIANSFLLKPYSFSSISISGNLYN